MENETLIIGISGASASGKTLLAKNIASQLDSEQVLTISTDTYYKDYPELSYEELIQINYDHPETLDADLLMFHLQELIRGNSVEMPIYDFVTYHRLPETNIVSSRPIIVIEGIFLFAIEQVRELLDIKIFVDPPLDVSLVRRVQRDIVERGRTFDYVLDQYQSKTRPMYSKFVEPSKHYADLIVPHGGKNQIAIDLIKAKLYEWF